MRKPPKRIQRERNLRDPKGRRLRRALPARTALQGLAERARFQPWEKHKLHPRRFGLPLYNGIDEDRTFCDGDADFEPRDYQRIPNWLRQGILAGLISENDINGDPQLIWAITEAGWIFEGRITIPGQAVYHGYPVLPNEAIAADVLSRCERTLLQGRHQDMAQALAACRRRYPS